MFPLEMMAFPGERIHLHIFEPCYKALTKDCLEHGSTFGLLPVIHNKHAGYGAEMAIGRVAKTYPDGRMDLVTHCHGLLEVVDFMEATQRTSYHKARVQRLERDYEPHFTIHADRLVELSHEWGKVIGMPVEPDADPELPLSFALAHKLGLSLKKELELALMDSESQRQQELIAHLEKLIPQVKEIERSRQIIQMNGHFRNLSPPDF